MLSSQSDLKELSDWVELDYFRRRRQLGRWRTYVVRAFWIGSLLICAGLIALPFSASSRLTRIYQSGPVSLSHAMFNEDCNRCHIESFRTWERFAHQDENLRSVKDDTCRECHPVLDHNPDRAFTPACAGCHPEHRGQPILANVRDDQCTVCHGALVTKSGRAADFAYTVTHFAAGEHPEFGAWQGSPKDPGTIRFNHRVHLQEEGVLELDPKQQGLLQPGVPNSSGLIPRRLKLDCTDCHQPDSAGRYMLPIRFDRHCQACHPLLVQIVGLHSNSVLRKAADDFSRNPVPHPVRSDTAIAQPCSPSISSPAPFAPAEAVRAVLRERFTAFVQKNASAIPNTVGDGPVRTLPGKRQPTPLSEGQWTWVNKQLVAAEDLLFKQGGGCRYCHNDPLGRRADGLPTYVLPQIPDRWFCHSRFSHDAHRPLRCLACHQDALTSTKTEDVLMPNIRQCQECHKPSGGARIDCVECHSYHERAGPQAHGKVSIMDLTQHSGTFR